MASIDKCKGNWRAQVRRGGQTLSKTFRLKADADWPAPRRSASWSYGGRHVRKAKDALAGLSSGHVAAS